MINAVVLIKAAAGKVKDVAEALVDTSCVTEVYSVAGRFDLVAIIRAKNTEGMAEAVTQRFQGIPGIVSTETLIAFRAFSNYDLERVFDFD